MTETKARAERPRVGLFATCLVDLFRPSVGFAAARLLQQAGCTVEVPQSQTCCGQPAYNAGNRQESIGIARQVIAAFDGYDYVVAPSGSCAGMLSHHYPKLLADDPDWAEPARNLARRTYELMAFLVDVRGMRTVDGVSFEGPLNGEGARNGRVTYHDSCSGLRELKVKAQPRQLLDSVAGLEREDLPEEEVCCGFGGTFCIKYPDISNQMVSEKTERIVATGAGTVLAGDLGCLLNMAGKLKRDGKAVEVRHVAEVLAGMTDVPAIGEPAKG